MVKNGMNFDLVQEGNYMGEYDFLGICLGGKKCKQRKEDRQEFRAQKREATVAQKFGKAELTAAKSDAVRAGTFQSAASGVVGTITSGLGKVFGGGAGEAPAGTGAAPGAEVIPGSATPPAEKKGLSTGVIVMAVIVIGTLIYFVTRKKKAPVKA